MHSAFWSRTPANETRATTFCRCNDHGPQIRGLESRALLLLAQPDGYELKANSYRLRNPHGLVDTASVNGIRGAAIAVDSI